MQAQTGPARILIADDHAVVREGLHKIINRCSDLHVIGEAADGEAAENLVKNLQADLLVLDITLPGNTGLKVLQSVRRRGYSLPILLFSMHPAMQYADFARRNGAQGFVNKGEDSSILLQAIRRLLQGGTWFPHLESQLCEQINPFGELSRREIEVMVGLLNGESLEKIGKKMGVGSKTVSTYRRRLLDKLNLENNAELILMAAQYPMYDFSLSSKPDRQEVSK